MLTTRDDSTELDNSPPGMDASLVERTFVFARHYSLNKEESWRMRNEGRSQFENEHLRIQATGGPQGLKSVRENSCRPYGTWSLISLFPGLTPWENGLRRSAAGFRRIPDHGPHAKLVLTHTLKPTVGEMLCGAAEAAPFQSCQVYDANLRLRALGALHCMKDRIASTASIALAVVRSLARLSPRSG